MEKDIRIIKIIPGEENKCPQQIIAWFDGKIFFCGGEVTRCCPRNCYLDKLQKEN